MQEDNIKTIITLEQLLEGAEWKSPKEAEIASNLFEKILDEKYPTIRKKEQDNSKW